MGQRIEQTTAGQHRAITRDVEFGVDRQAHDCWGLNMEGCDIHRTSWRIENAILQAGCAVDREWCAAAHKLTARLAEASGGELIYTLLDGATTDHDVAVHDQIAGEPHRTGIALIKNKASDSPRKFAVNERLGTNSLGLLVGRKAHDVSGGRDDAVLPVGGVAPPPINAVADPHTGVWPGSRDNGRKQNRRWWFRCSDRFCQEQRTHQADE